MERIKISGENEEDYKTSLEEIRNGDILGDRKMTEFEKGIAFGIQGYLHSFLDKHDIDHTPEDLFIENRIVIKKMKKDKDGSDIYGKYDPISKKIELFFLENKDNPRFIISLIHEAFHSLSHSSLTFIKNDLVIRDSIGLSIRSKDNERLFGKLDEAFTQFLTEKFIKEELPKDFQEQYINSIEAPYQKEKKMLSDFIKIINDKEKILSLEGKDSLSESDVYKLFLDAYFSGKILPFSRLIEKHFGNGGFRKFAEAFKS